jgi:galactose oxidase-like protein
VALDRIHGLRSQAPELDGAAQRSSPGNGRYRRDGLGSVTHAFDMNQRFQKLSFTADSRGLWIKAPANRKRTPPGHYRLFILDGAGAPSVAKIVQVK